MRQNVELKAFDRDPARTLERLFRLGAVDAGLLVQRDTYFKIPHGRLKLREEEGRPAILIRYERGDDPKPRTSNYELTEVADADAIRNELAESFGIRVVVEKRRRLLLWERTVRVHLDDVQQLGCFIEIEAVAAQGSSLEREFEQVDRIVAALGIADIDILAVGYADLLERADGRNGSSQRT